MHACHLYSREAEISDFQASEGPCVRAGEGRDEEWHLRLASDLSAHAYTLERTCIPVYTRKCKHAGRHTCTQVDTHAHAYTTGREGAENKGH